MFIPRIQLCMQIHTVLQKICCINMIWFQKIITLKTFQHVNCLTKFAISGNAAGRLLSAFFKALYWVFKDKDPKNLSLKSQLCEASMQTHMHAYVCAQWESTSGHCHHTHCLPTAAVVSKHFWLYILLLEIAKSLFIYQFLEDLEICLPLEISVMWSTHTHALVCHGKSASCNAHTLVCNGESVSHSNAHCFFLPTAAAPK